MIGRQHNTAHTWNGAQPTTTQPTESVHTALGGVSPPTVIATIPWHLFHTKMYYIVIDGVQQSVSFQWEEALIEAAQCDFELNAPELNNGIQGTHDVQIMSFQEMMEADDVVMVF